MGLFDFFKNKDGDKTPNSNPPKSELYLSISKYNEYIVSFVRMHSQGNYAPISAYEKANGEVVGFVYTIDNESTYSLLAQDVVARMETNFEKKLASGEIKSYAILYHSQFANDNNHNIATNDDELKAITVEYHFKNSHKGKIGLPYTYKNDEINYGGFKEFSQQENNSIFGTQLQQGKDYFKDREKIAAPVMENEIGLKITKSNNSDLANTWCGIFGFESYRKPNGSNVLKEHFALALTKGTHQNKGTLATYQLAYDNVVFKAVTVDGKAKTILPVIKTNYVIDVVNKEINEWENVGNLEALVTGGGRNTFGITYFATDYAENREIYLSKKELNIKISGIVFVLDISNIHKQEGELKYSEDFTMYMPNKDLPNYACFDFVGQLEDFKEVHILETKSLKGYIMKMKLITNPDVKDFFTIDMYVTQENIRFKDLQVGMKLTGMFQMQGQIAEGPSAPL